MKTERELFEEWYERAIGRSIVYKTYDKSYLNSKTQEAWLTWQASASREGYKLVPVEPPEDMDIKICRLVDHRIDVFEADRIYKAMIGAADE